MYNVGLVGARMLERLLDGEPGMVGWEFDCDELKPLLFEMFGYQNELIERLEIGENVNERASRDLLDVVQDCF